MKFAKRMDRLSTSIFSELAAKKAELIKRGAPVIDLSVGTPNIPPEPRLLEIISKEAAKPKNYLYALEDTMRLREAAAEWYKRRYGVTLGPESEVISLLGSQDGLAHIALAVCDEGDTVLAPDPGYPIFSIGPQIAGAEIYPMPLRRENGYLIDFSAIPGEVAKRASLMVVSYPNNPVTAMAPPEFYRELVAFAKKYDIIVVHDNAYSELVFDSQPSGSFLAYPGAKDVGIEFNSLSKTYGLAGARIGFALGNREVIARLRTLKSNIDYGMFLPLQEAAIEAITGPQDCVSRTVSVYRRRRDLLVSGLGALGWEIDKPPATMFVWAKLPCGRTDSTAFVLELLEKANVLFVPGISFGPEGEGYVRMALVQDEETIARAIKQIGRSGILN